MNEMLKIYEQESETKNGFKKTKIGWIPDDWNEITLGEFGETYSGLSGKSKEDFGHGTNYIPYLNIFGNTIIDTDYFDKVRIENGERQNSVKYGDIFFTTSSETPQEVGMCSVYLGEDIELYLNSFCFGFRLNEISELDPKYLSHFFRSDLGRKLMNRLAQGATRYNLSKRNLLIEKFNVPPYIEQQKIASILSEWDDIIGLKKDFLKSKVLLRKGLEQNLLSGKIRLKEFINSNEKNKTKIGILPKDWKLVPLSKTISRVREKLTPLATEEYRQIGIRSHCRGIFHKEPVSGKSLGNKSVFWVQKDCFVVNIVFAWEHAIAKTTLNEEGMIASHRFPMYKPNESLDLDFLLYFFKTAMGKHLLGLASPGGAGRNKTLGQTEFVKLKMPIPPIEEQKSIVSTINASDKEIDLLKLEIQTLEDQKNGLMQQLLTGKIRVKVN